MASRRWSSGRNVIVYASTPGFDAFASTVTMLESRPALRKLETGTSARRCAATDSSMSWRTSACGPAAATAEVQQLDAEGAAGHDQPAGPLVEQGEGEHPAEPLEACRPPRTPRLEHDLGVGRGRERRAGGDELVAQLPVVVELAVVDEA